MLNVKFPEEKTNKRKSPDVDNWQESSQRRRGKPRINGDPQKGKSSNSDHQGGNINREKSNGGNASKGSKKSQNVKRAKKSFEREDYKFKDAYTLSDELKEKERQKQAAQKTNSHIPTQNRAQDVASESKNLSEPRKKQNVKKVSGSKKNSNDVRPSKNSQKKVPAIQVKEKLSKPTPKEEKVEKKPKVAEHSLSEKEGNSNSADLSSLPVPEEDSDKNSNNQKKTSKKRKHLDNVQVKSGKKSKSQKKQMTMVSSVQYKRPETPEEKALLFAVVAEVKKMLKKKKLSKETFKFICKHCAGNIFTRLVENARISKPKKLVRSRKEKIKALIDAECKRVAGHKSKAKS